MNLLFVSWDGPQVTYVQGLFLPIFQRLREHGVNTRLMQFTWASAERVEHARKVYETAGFACESIRVCRFPKAPGAVLTALYGSYRIRQAVRKHAIDVIMPRSIMPGLATLLARGIRDVAVIFDADGLPIDERVEFLGESPRSIRQQLMYEVEAQTIRRAQVVLVRTAWAADILRNRSRVGADAVKFQIMPNGRDARQFHPFDSASRAHVRAQLGIPQNAPLLVYAGSIGPQYCLREMLLLFIKVHRRRPDAKLLMLSNSPELISATSRELSVPSEAMVQTWVSPEKVPEYLACGDLGMGLRQSSFSMRAVAPIKVGEYLLCGVPVLASTVVDSSRGISAGTGFVMDDINQSTLETAAEWFVNTVIPNREGFRERCRQMGVSSFSLEASEDAYLRALMQISVRHPKTGL